MTTTIEAPASLVASVDRKAFADAATWVGRAVKTGHSDPVLGNVHVRFASGGITLSAFDGTTSARRTIAADGAGEGATLVSGRLLAEIAKSLPNKPVTLTLDGEVLAVTAGASRFTLPAADPAPYPALPATPEASGTVDGDAFADIIDRSSKALGRDDTLPMLTAIRLEIDGDKITAVATDRFRLAINTARWDNPAKNYAELLVPGKAATELVRGITGPVTIGTNERIAGFDTSEGSTTTRTLDLEFPQVRRLIPAEFHHAARVDTSQLAAAVKRVAIVAERGVRVVLNIDTEAIRVTAGDDDGQNAVDQVDCDLIGEPITVAFNPAFLLDALATTGPTTQLGFVGPNKPAILTPAGGDHSTDWDAFDNNHLHLLMPVRI